MFCHFLRKMVFFVAYIEFPFWLSFLRVTVNHTTHEQNTMAAAAAAPMKDIPVIQISGGFFAQVGTERGKVTYCGHPVIGVLKHGDARDEVCECGMDNARACALVYSLHGGNSCCMAQQCAPIFDVCRGCQEITFRALILETEEGIQHLCTSCVEDAATLTGIQLPVGKTGEDVPLVQRLIAAVSIPDPREENQVDEMEID